MSRAGSTPGTSCRLRAHSRALPMATSLGTTIVRPPGVMEHRWREVILIVWAILLGACGTQTGSGERPGAGVASDGVVGPTPMPVVSATPTPLYYEVQPGETLWDIAQRYGVNPDILAEVNELDDPNLIQPGQQLLISERVTISGRVLPTATPTPRPCLEGCRQPPPGCEIKGIVAQLDGTRLYLLPDDELYNLRTADLWFCRAVDAQNAGWLHWTPSGPEAP
jgi:LysM repeat protein